VQLPQDGSPQLEARPQIFLAQPALPVALQRGALLAADLLLPFFA
jgi:hypothetical protein